MGRIITEYNIHNSKTIKSLEIYNGLEEIQKLENDIIKLAETRAKRILVSGSVQEIDNEIAELLRLQKNKTVTNLHLQMVWVNRSKQQAV